MTISKIYPGIDKQIALLEPAITSRIESRQKVVSSPYLEYE
jgi:hypothetical protein